jgi:hypothetical protein
MRKDEHRPRLDATYLALIIALDESRAQCEIAIGSTILTWMNSTERDAPLALTPFALGLGERLDLEPMEIEVLDVILTELFHFRFQSSRRVVGSAPLDEWRVASDKEMGLDLYCRERDCGDMVYFLIGNDG